MKMYMSGDSYVMEDGLTFWCTVMFGTKRASTLKEFLTEGFVIVKPTYYIFHKPGFDKFSRFDVIVEEK